MEEALSQSLHPPTFAYHLAAIEGSTNVPDFHEDKSVPTMIGGLGLAAASVSPATQILPVLFWLSIGGKGTNVGCHWDVDHFAYLCQ